MLQKIKQFLAEVALEGKRINWPSRRDLVDSTLVVIIFIVLLAITIMVCDVVIRKVLALILG
ncbi:MAG: preprotein translocase subunit SecE [Kiritimatiellae bacterium]|nr:preprotein translocase subunit SecE [Kiritimatiellia bacterium]MBR4946773.1 preprotein translocase subunit SecE [Kiritimatiellia bacterium]MBR5587803.1 preprotein translocase subunit SecE [Kiritimatiellia bacterium]